MVVNDRGRDGATEVIFEFSRECDGGEGVETKGLKRSVGIEAGGRYVERGGDAAGEPRLEGERRVGWRNFRSRWVRGTGRRVEVNALYHGKFVGEPLAAGLSALDLAAGGLRESRWFYENEDGGGDIVFVGERAPDGRSDGSDIKETEGGAFDFEDEPAGLRAGAGVVEREGGGRIGAQRGMCGGRGRFQVLWVVIATADDDDVFPAARDEEFAVEKKAEVASAEVARAAAREIQQAGFEGFGREVWVIPIPGTDAGSGGPDLANGPVG